MAYMFAAMGAGSLDDRTGGRIYPIFPLPDEDPLEALPIDTIERANPATPNGSGDVLITHSYGAMSATAISGYGYRVTPTGSYYNNGREGWTSRARGFYLSGVYVIQEYSTQSNSDRSARYWKTIVCRNEPVTQIGSNWWNPPALISRTERYNYRISNADHPYAEWPEDVLAEQLALCLEALPPPGTTRSMTLTSINLVSELEVTGEAKYLDISDVTGYWRSRTWHMPGVYSSNFNGGFSEAYYQAISKLPQLQQNIFNNILETVSLIRSFMDGFQATDLRRIEKWKETAQDAWLGYRYEYSTTVSDLEEITSALIRLDSLLHKTYVRTYGVGHEGIMTCHCCAVVDMGGYISDLHTYLNRINLRPTLYNLWDMVPYSFIVDWFTHIGDILDSLQQWLDAPSFPVVDIWYSFNVTYEDDTGARTEIYGRWRGSAPSLPYIDVSSASSRTLWMRIADSVSLLF